MRIQHNIMAMSAYRNYTNNVSAMKKNLEKLSSGYKINRAGDDAAGLAISEKMRAQITGLETAQKNAKDGISLVQTAEGALTEVHDMLNRMVELATQSANGTYDNETDRYQLQKEVDQLRDEINRIADSSNFNGIKLLDGSMSEGGQGTSVAGIDRIIDAVLGAGEDPVVNTGVKTILDGGENASKATKFDVDFTGLTAAKGEGTPAGAATYTPAATGVPAGVTATVDADTATAGDVKVEVKTATAAAATVAGADALQGATFGYADNGAAGNFTIKFIASDTATSGTWDDTTKTLTVALDKTGGAGGTYDAAALKTAINGLTVAGAPDLTKVNITGALNTDLDASGGGNAALGSVTMTGGKDAGFDVVLTSGAGTYTENVATADWTGTVNITGDKGVSVAIDTAQSAGAFAEATVGTVAAGAAAVPGADSSITFKIGNTELVTDVTVTAAAADGKATATEIATAVFGALADANATKIGNNTYKVTDNGNGKLTFELTDDPTATNIQGNYDWDVSMKDATGAFAGNHTAGTVVTQQGQVGAAGSKANTVFNMTTGDLKDGTKITIDGKTVTLAVGADSKIATKKEDGTAADGVIDLTSLDPSKAGGLVAADLNYALGKISEGFKDGTTNFIVGVNDKSNGDTNIGLTVHKKDASTQTYDTKEKLAEVFSIETPGTGKALTLQIGDTADDYNQLKVDIKACDSKSLGLDKIDISKQENAQDAITAIKNAINQVSDVRGGLGATQNRLDHTINNLSVMTENIQDAESTIRDVDVAEEMMAYTKNNILIQSAQAMLAQANQVPQGVLQLLG